MLWCWWWCCWWPRWLIFIFSPKNIRLQHSCPFLIPPCSSQLRPGCSCRACGLYIPTAVKGKCPSAEKGMPYTRTLVHTKAFPHTHKQQRVRTSICTQMLVCTGAFTDRCLYTQMILHRKLFFTDAFYHKGSCTQKLLHTGCFFSPEAVHTDACAQNLLQNRCFHSQNCVHTGMLRIVVSNCEVERVAGAKNANTTNWHNENESINQSTNQSINQPINQSISQSIKQSINQSLCTYM